MLGSKVGSGELAAKGQFAIRQQSILECACANQTTCDYKVIDPAYCRKKVLHRGLVSLVKCASENPKLLGGGSNFLR